MKSKFNFSKIILISSLSLVFSQGFAKDVLTTTEDQKRISVTIYNDNLALVKDVRHIHKLEENILWKDVSSQIISDSTQLRNVEQTNFHLISQNYDFDLLTPNKLLEKYIGKTVTVIKTNPQNGTETKEEATVLATNSGVILKYNDRIESGVQGRISFKELPLNLKEKPTLTLQIDPLNDKPSNLELSYLTKGISWKASYVANLSDKEESMNLISWITLTNTSGASYSNANVQLVAGDVNQVKEKMRVAPMIADAMPMSMAKSGAKPTEETLSEYHLYSLPYKISIKDNQTKQVSLFNLPNIKINKQHTLNGSDYYYHSLVGNLGEKLKFDTTIDFINTSENGSGTPLPKGIFRVYKNDSMGNAQFLGEDNIDHTAKKDKVSINLGKSFDLFADKKQLNWEKVTTKSRHNFQFESEYEIKITNSKKEDTFVTILEPIPGDWEMLNSSHPYTKENSSTASWNIKIPTNKTVTLKYKVRVKQ